MQGLNLNVIDTAGIRQTEDLVEKMGVDKSKKNNAQKSRSDYLCGGCIKKTG